MNLAPSQFVALGLSFFCALLLVVLATVLTKRKLRRDFPAFFTYVLLGAIVIVIAMAGYIQWCRPYFHNPNYFYMFSALSALMTVIEFAVMYEVFVNTLKPYSALIDLARVLFRWAGLFLLITASLTALASTDPNNNRVVVVVSLLERSSRLMQCGLLLLFFLFQKKLALSWRTHNVSIALGLGVTAAVDLASSYFKGAFPAFADALSMSETALFIGVLAFWTYCLAQPSPAHNSILDSPSRLIFQRWDEAFAGYGYGSAGSPSTVESFLPGIEKTVDRVMARRVS